MAIEEIESLMAKIRANDSYTTLKDKVSKTKSNVEEAASASIAVKDSYGNSLTATGTDDKVLSFTKYGFDNDTMNWTLWSALYNDSWVFRRAIDKPAQDIIRCGITINCKHKKDEIMKTYHSLQQPLIELLQWGALFGGSIAVMMFDNVKDKEMSKPLSKDKLKNAKTIKLYVTDRWYGCAPSADTVKEMTDSDFGKPEYYNVTFANGSSFKIHHSYVLRYEHRTAPRLIKNGQLQGWGYAEGAHILNELSRDDQLKAAITSLVNKSLIEVIKMDGMRGVFLGADADNEAQLKKRLEMVNWGRSYNSLTFLDSQDQYDYHQLNVGGLSDLLEKNMRLIAAALEMQGVLYGDLDGGFSADQVAMERYDDTIQCRADAYYRHVCAKLLKVLYVMHDVDEDVDFTFNSLLMKKQDEKRLEGLKDFQSLLSGLISDGVLTPVVAAKALQTYSTKGVIDFGINDEYIEKLRKEDEESMEDYEDDKDEETTSKKKSFFKSK